ncbi:class I SAM-dependent methyltransferase [Actinokineospora iranica]|uniref:Carnitine O-acetyltransferase n=1 Tax=Actinokineospora iranica TaxID=1271860 RepID=A0A1G6LKK8_9PSEU|nr:class I SAM-dependent methyltransferase [Actinokineospora iranica]SDC43664.1 carnitine O-acetyltransferase [Actinokineospora iranica]
MRFDPTGKISFDHIYTQPDPRPYFSALRGLDYCIPEQAKPYFTKLIGEYREASGVAAPTVLDIGCSYGINAALIACDATMDELYAHYTDPAVADADRDTLVARDRELVRARKRLEGQRFIGFDASAPALSYAHAAGFLDDVVNADLESRDPTEDERARLGSADVVISTGCVGYVTEKTIARVAGAHGERKPWMAHFVLRMFPFDSVADALAGLGYETVHVEGVFKQRRFASAEEQSQVLQTLAATGADPYGLEADGWLYARLFISRPRELAR